MIRDAADLLLPLQVGVGVQGGCEAAFHSIRTLVEKFQDDEEMCLLKVDFKNAFNLMSRQHILTQVKKHFPGLLPWVSFSLGTEGTLFIDDVHSIKSSRGVQQGDPLGPLLFSLGLHSIPSLIEQEFKDENFFQVWYLDDGVLIGKRKHVLRALDLINAESKSFGMELNLQKCEI